MRLSSSRTLVVCTVSLGLFIGLHTVSNAQGIVYATTNSNGFGTLNLGTGAFTRIANETPSFYSLAETPSGTLYAIDTNLKLDTINKVTGALTVGPGSSIFYGMTSRPSDSTLFINNGDGLLFTLDPSNSTTSFIGSASNSFAEFGNLTFGPGASLYTVLGDDTTGTEYLATRNTTNGAVTHVGTNLGSSVYEGLVYSNSALYAVNGLTDTIDNVTTGTAVSTGVQISGLGPNEHIYAATTEADTATPEPGPVSLLAGLGLVVSGLTVRRRR